MYCCFNIKHKEPNFNFLFPYSKANVAIFASIRRMIFASSRTKLAGELGELGSWKAWELGSWGVGKELSSVNIFYLVEKFKALQAYLDPAMQKYKCRFSWVGAYSSFKKFSDRNIWFATTQFQ